MSLDIQGLIE
jgi:hypothetical protein